MSAEPDDQTFYDETAPFKLDVNSTQRNINTNARITQLLFSGEHSDIKVCVKDPSNLEKTLIEIPAHSMVLASRSPVFMNMLASGKYKETAERSIHLAEGITQDVAQQFLYILYSDDFSLVQPKQIPALAQLGHVYQVECITDFIKDTLDFIKSPSNVFDLIKMFSRISENYELLIEYAADHAEEIFLADAHLLADPQSLYDMLSSESLSCPESLAADAVIRYACAHALRAEEFYRLYTRIRFSGLFTEFFKRQYISPYFSPAETEVIFKMIEQHYLSHPIVLANLKPDERLESKLERSSFVSAIQQISRPAIPALGVAYRPIDLDQFRSKICENSDEKKNDEASWLKSVPQLINVSKTAGAVPEAYGYSSPFFLLHPTLRHTPDGKPQTVWGKDFHSLVYGKLSINLIRVLSGNMPRGLLPVDTLVQFYPLKVSPKGNLPDRHFAKAKETKFVWTSNADSLIEYFICNQKMQTPNYSIFSHWLPNAMLKESKEIFEKWKVAMTSKAYAYGSRTSHISDLTKAVGVQHAFDYDDDLGVSPCDSALLCELHGKAEGKLFSPDGLNSLAGNVRRNFGFKPKPKAKKRNIERWSCPNCQNEHDWVVMNCATCRQVRPDFVKYDWPFSWICPVDNIVNVASTIACAGCVLPRAVDAEMIITSDSAGDAYLKWKATGVFVENDSEMSEAQDESKDQTVLDLNSKPGAYHEQEQKNKNIVTRFTNDPVNEVSIRQELQNLGVQVEERKPPPPAFNRRQRIMNIFIVENDKYDPVPHIRQIDWSLTRAYEVMNRGSAKDPEDDLLDAARSKMNIDDVVDHNDLVLVDDVKVDEDAPAPVIKADDFVPGWTPTLANVSKKTMDLRNNLAHDKSSYTLRPKINRVTRPENELTEQSEAENDAFAKLAPFERLSRLTNTITLPVTNRGEGCNLSPTFVITNAVVPYWQDREAWKRKQLEFLNGTIQSPGKNAYYVDSLFSLCETRVGDNTNEFAQQPDESSEFSYVERKPGYIGDLTLELLLAHDVVFLSNLNFSLDVPESLSHLLSRYVARGGSVVLDGSSKGFVHALKIPLNEIVESKLTDDPYISIPPHVRLPLNSRLFSNRVNAAASMSPGVMEETDHLSLVRELSRPAPNIQLHWLKLCSRPFQLRQGYNGVVDTLWGTLNSSHILQGYVRHCEQCPVDLNNGIQASVNSSTWYFEVPVFRDAAGSLWLCRRPVDSSSKQVVYSADRGTPQFIISYLTQTAAAGVINLIPGDEAACVYSNEYYEQWQNAFMNPSKKCLGDYSDTEYWKSWFEKAKNITPPFSKVVTQVEEVLQAEDDSKVDSMSLLNLIPINSNLILEKIAEKLIPSSVVTARRRRIGTIGVCSIRFVAIVQPVDRDIENGTFNVGLMNAHKARIQRVLKGDDQVLSLDAKAVERFSILLNMLLSAASKSSIRRPEDTKLAPGQRPRFVELKTAIRRKGQLLEDAQFLQKRMLENWHHSKQ